MIRKTLRRAVFGYVLGMAIGNLIAALTGHPNIVSAELLQKAGSLNAALLWQTLLSGLIGAAGMGGTMLYEIERWPLLAIDIAHYALVMAVFVPVSRCLGWCREPAELAITAAIMFAVHFSIFCIMCAIYRRRVKELNTLQKKFLADHKIQGGIV